MTSARKEEKYAAQALNHIFILIAIETMGPISSKASSCLQELGCRLSATNGVVAHESAFLFQRQSIVLQQ